MSGTHLPGSAGRPPRPRGVVPLDLDLGVTAGQRIVLLSLERWDGWADLRFARIDVGADAPLPRRVPPVDAWSITADGEPLEVTDAVGRGDRAFSNGEVRLVPAPPAGAHLQVGVRVVSGADPLTGGVTLPA